METPGQRILKWREYLGKTPKEFEALTGIPYSTLKTLETDPKKGKPSFDVLAKLRKAFPQLNIDWLFDEGATEPMLREGRALMPAARPAPIELSQDEHRRELVATAENVLLRQLLASKDELIDELRGKPNGSTDAADYFDVAPAPQGPRAGAYLLPRLRVQGLRRYQQE